MTGTICKILLSIMIGILSTGLLTLGVDLAVCCVDELTNYIQGCSFNVPSLQTGGNYFLILSL